MRAAAASKPKRAAVSDAAPAATPAKKSPGSATETRTAETAPAAKPAKSATATKTSGAAKTASAAKSAATKAAGATKTSSATKTSEASKTSAAAKTTRSSKTSSAAKTSRAAKSSKAAKPTGSAAKTTSTSKANGAAAARETTTAKAKANGSAAKTTAKTRSRKKTTATARRRRLQYKVGQQLVYPLQGVGQVTTIEERPFREDTLLYYVVYLEVSDMTIMVPVEKADELGIRAIVPRAEATGALRLIGEDYEPIPTDWKLRYQMNLDLLKAGAVTDIATVVRALYHRSRIKELPILERKLYDNARSLLVDELSFSLGKDKGTIEEMINARLEVGVKP